MGDDAPHNPSPPDTHDPVARRHGWLGLFLRGLGMGAADVVPGVSGGTIAFITGIYERFVQALRSLSARPIVELVRGRPTSALVALRAFDWALLLPLGAGIVVAIVMLSRVITGLMESRPGPTYALFFGLIAASAYAPIARIPRVGARHVGAIALAAILAFFVVGLTSDAPPMQTTADPAGATHALALEKVRAPADADALDLVRDDQTLALFDPDEVIEQAPERVELIRSETELEAFVAFHDELTILEPARPTLAYIFLCGVIAISAMILPGLSGSFLLLLLGVYHAVFGALHRVVDYLTFWSDPDALTALSARPAWGDGALVGVFLVGVAVGLATFSRIVAWLFERAHDVTMAALTGLMIGALRLPFAEMTADPARTNGASYWAIVALVALAGVGIVLALHVVERRMHHAPSVT